MEGRGYSKGQEEDGIGDQEADTFLVVDDYAQYEAKDWC